MDNKKIPKNKKSYYKKNNTISTTITTAKTWNLDSSKHNGEWSFYFPENIPEGDLKVLTKLKAVKLFLSSYSEEKFVEIYKTRSFTLDVANILSDEHFKSSWPDYIKDLEYNPNMVIGLFGYAAQNIIKEKSIPDCVKNRENEADLFSNRKIIPHFIRLDNYVSFQDLKSYNYGRFVTVQGIVVRSSDEKPICLEIAFSCIKCREITISLQEKGCYTSPNRCSISGCNSTKLKPSLQSLHTVTIPWKSIRLQELNTDQSEGGRVPRSIECELTNDLTNLCVPGDVVIISGIVDVNNVNEKKTTIGKDACSYAFYINVNSVTCIKGKNVDGIEVGADNINLKPDDINIIKQIRSEPNLFRLLVASLSPNIFGHEIVKAGLILVLFGGGYVPKKEEAKKKFSVRENSHILIVGDPGLGKSQMLLASASVSPRGVYVCGNSTTASGLTVTVTKEGGGENSLEAGALVLADQGHCCIDEFDKMMQQHSALLEAMEQQTISMAKSGVVCTLPARTSIIAAANPTGGHYSRNKTVSENLKIKGALLSRFDLVFILQDQADMSFDDKMSEHVMAHYADKSELVTLTTSNVISSPHFDKSFSALSHSLSDCNRLKEKLQVKFNEKLNIIPHSTLQKYISYARKFSQPKLTPEVCEILKQFYLEMRKEHNFNYSTPITTRQLESLIRLTRARARVELRAFCTKDDAVDVIEIMKYSMRDTFSDEFGNIDIDRSVHGSGMSKRSQVKTLIKALTKAAQIKADDHFTVKEIKDIAESAKISTNNFESFLEMLNDQGFLLKKGFQLYKIQTV